MTRHLFTLLASCMIFLMISCAGTDVKSPVVPDGYQGIYVVKIWKGDNSVLPKNLTGLVLKRTGESYEIILSNIDIKSKSAEEIEKLEYDYANGEFLIKFGSLMKVKPVKNGLKGTLDFDGKPAALYLEKIK